MSITFGSVCSGIEAATVAWKPLGWEASWLSEIEPFPSEVLKHHYPNTPNLGDMTKIADKILSKKVPAPDVLVGGTPCFTAGHLVLTDNGYIPIEDIKPCMSVVTHTGRLQKVLRVGSKDAKVGSFRAVGLPDGLVCTPEHPFMSVDFEMKNTRREGNYARVEILGDVEWTPAKDMKGKQWCALLNYQIQQPTIMSTKFTDEEVMYIAGVYLGDGHIRRWKGKNKKAVVLSLNHSKLERLGDNIELSKVSISEERTSVRVTIGDTALAEWLTDNFGELSGGKRISAWCLSSPHRELLLQGYLDSDGTGRGGRYSASSVSKSLAFGVADLANACGFVSSAGFVKTADTAIIEGRIVNQRDYWQVRMFDRDLSKKSRVRHDMLLRLAQGYEETHTDTVFNIEVEGDNSYILNGVIVHNCQAFSVAGMREGLADPRGELTIRYVELADAIDNVRQQRGEQPAIIVWENVPGVLSDKTGAFGCFLGALAGEDCELQPAGKRWSNAGCVYGPKRAIAWRVLDAQYFGLAQRRKHVFVVASARDGFDPSKILFEFDGLRRDIAPSREAWQDATTDARGSIKATSFQQNASGELREGSIVGTLNTNSNPSGRNTPMIRYEQKGFEKLTFDNYTKDKTASHWDGVENPHPTLSQSHNTGGIGASNQELFSQRGAGLVQQGFRMTAFGEFADDNTAPTMKARDYKDATDLVAYGVPGNWIGRKPENGGNSTQFMHEVSPAQTATDRHGVVAFNNRQDPVSGEVFGGLDTGIPQVKAIAIQGTVIGRKPENGPQGQGYDESGVCFTQTAVDRHAVATQTAVRRLTPIECERLQGFPDNYTQISWRGKPATECPDGHRYKALGNSMAVPCMRWIGNRIEAHLELTT